MRISVIIPVFNGSATLPQCLQALADSRYPASQCIVIDDGSTDDSVGLAERSGATVLSTGGRFGPARARNLGARHATGDVLLFLDADVEVHPDTLARIAERFAATPDLDALIGSYDDSPSDQGFVSQFKNLMHSFTHHQGNQEAVTFWCGCGAVKREVYLEHGGLDESYRRPSIEDIEFGFRMVRSGRKLALDRRIRCRHLKAWTLWNLIRTDVLQRGVPWTELILRTRFLPNDLNLRWSQRVSVILSFILFLLGGLGILQLLSGRAWLPVAPVSAGVAMILAFLYVLNQGFYRFLAARKGRWYSLCGMALHILYFLYSGVSFALGIAVYGFRAVSPRPFVDPSASALLQGFEEDRR